MVFNNHGWGLRQMILCSAIIVIALLFVVFYSSRLMDGLGDVFHDSIIEDITYASIEESISTAALTYADTYYENEIGSGTITVTTTNLIQYDLLEQTDLITSSNDTCQGYVLLRKDEDNDLNAEPYIQCTSYETNNYQSWRVGE